MSSANRTVNVVHNLLQKQNIYKEYLYSKNYKFRIALIVQNVSRTQMVIAAIVISAIISFIAILEISKQ